MIKAVFPPKSQNFSLSLKRAIPSFTDLYLCAEKCHCCTGN